MKHIKATLRSQIIERERQKAGCGNDVDVIYQYATPLNMVYDRLTGDFAVTDIVAANNINDWDDGESSFCASGSDFFSNDIEKNRLICSICGCVAGVLLTTHTTTQEFHYHCKRCKGVVIHLVKLVATIPFANQHILESSVTVTEEMQLQNDGTFSMVALSESSSCYMLEETYHHHHHQTTTRDNDLLQSIIATTITHGFGNDEDFVRKQQEEKTYLDNDNKDFVRKNIRLMEKRKKRNEKQRMRKKSSNNNKHAINTNMGVGICV